MHQTSLTETLPAYFKVLSAAKRVPTDQSDESLPRRIHYHIVNKR
jgi:hypothetical protein